MSSSETFSLCLKFGSVPSISKVWHRPILWWTIMHRTCTLITHVLSSCDKIWFDVCVLKAGYERTTYDSRRVDFLPSFCWEWETRSRRVSMPLYTWSWRLLFPGDGLTTIVIGGNTTRNATILLQGFAKLLRCKIIIAASFFLQISPNGSRQCHLYQRGIRQYEKVIIISTFRMEPRQLWKRGLSLLFSRRFQAQDFPVVIAPWLSLFSLRLLLIFAFI